MFKRPVKFYTCKKTEHKRNPSARAVSCELEIASTEDDDGISRAVRKWNGSIVEDGSLPDSGFEINTSPASGDLLCEQVDEICNALRRSGAEITTDCGFHVHIDARDFSYFEIRKLIILYARIEEALFAMVPKSRRNNRYAGKCGETYLSYLKTGKECKKSIVIGTYGTTGRSIATKRKNKYEQCRYNALNLHSWFYRGTVECRLAAGASNPVNVRCWAMLWAMMLDYVYRTSEKDVQALVNSGASDFEVLLSVCATDEVRNFVKERTEKFS